MEVAPGLWRLVLPLPRHFLRAVNVYLLRDADGYVLIDCGLPIAEAWQALMDQLDALHVPPTAIHTIIATHGHPDHCGLAARLRAHCDARVWLHARDWQFVQQRFLGAESYRAVWRDWLARHGMPPEEAAAAAEGPGLVGRNIGLDTPDRLLDGGEDLTVGPYRLRVLWTPGHTPGHVCLYEPTRRFLLSGDHILPQVNPNVSLDPETGTNPLPGYLHSLRELAAMAIDLALPGHGEPFADLAARARESLGHQLDRRARLLALLGPHPQTAYALASQVWADSKPNNWDAFSGHLRRNALGTLTAHLEALVTDDLIARHDGTPIGYARRG
ncbi:MAG TPA: MBL fold metallo-hydrolase [Chloroflexota bacterium]|nr:MBL fold metallo-hydrolase [Chloroflexota bacterium]